MNFIDTIGIMLVTVVTTSHNKCTPIIIVNGCLIMGINDFFLLIKKPNVPNANGMSPLCLAANREVEDVEVAKFLISNGANVNQICGSKY